jgi:hypothetical protein
MDRGQRREAARSGRRDAGQELQLTRDASTTRNRFFGDLLGGFANLSECAEAAIP